MTTLGLTKLILIAAIVSVCSYAQVADAKKGKDLFLRYSCYACHGFSGQNGPGARLVPARMAQAAFIAYVRNPPRANLMPSFSAKVVPDAEMADIYAYVRTLPDSAPAVKSIPALNQILTEK